MFGRPAVACLHFCPGIRCAGCAAQGRERGRIARTLFRISRALIAPAAALVLGSGIWLVLADSARSFSQQSILLGLILCAAALAGAVGVTRLATRIQRAGTTNAARTHRLWLIGQGIVVLVLLGALVDMGLKPGA